MEAGDKQVGAVLCNVLPPTGFLLSNSFGTLNGAACELRTQTLTSANFGVSFTAGLDS